MGHGNGQLPVDMTDMRSKLFANILELAREQKKALEQGNVDLAAELQAARQELQEQIAALDREGPLGDVTVQGVIVEIIRLDEDMRNIIRREMSLMAIKLGGIDKARSFNRSVAAQKSLNTP